MEKILEAFLAFIYRHPQLKRIADVLLKWLFANVADLDSRNAMMQEEAYSDVT